ncbi:hypothetical protein D0Z08_18880 [Nocardioides immobilis]|uniref:Phospholipase/carboxylesterase/thioesterase domain-containing protein n=1 Tax=Nocardioides immobilis TaxID=2049295 RepID=A0A417XYY1_9ACTN|nr:hypothetical protein [Nocardioides immobilis]RHW25571.1 hypothetical protein D0Z08_18880 [Nocardioides immobilis]
MGVSRCLVALVTAVALTLVVPPGEAAEAMARTDLTVRSGSFAKSGPLVRAEFRVGAQRAEAPPSRATLGLRDGARWIGLAVVRVPRIGTGRVRTVRAEGTVASVRAGTYTVVACADRPGRVAERAEGNNCRDLGRVRVGTSLCDRPGCAPIDHPSGSVFDYTDRTGTYWAHEPNDAINGPFAVLIWLHGCAQGSSSAVRVAVDRYDEHYVTIAPDGADGACWKPGELGDAGVARILRTIESVVAHFDVRSDRIVLGGYSIGGVLAYRTAFYHARLIAGVIAVNAAPFRRSESRPASSLAAARWRFPVLHLAHDADKQFPLTKVRSEVRRVRRAGHSIGFMHLPGTHYDLQTQPHIKRHAVEPGMAHGWTSP